MTNYILIFGFVLLIFLLYEVRGELKRIRCIMEMTEKEKHRHDLSIDDPEVYEEILEAEASKKNKQ